MNDRVAATGSPAILLALYNASRALRLYPLENEAVRRAMYMQAGFEWRQRKNLGVNQMNAAGIAMNIAPAKLLPEVEQTLMPLRRIV